MGKKITISIFFIVLFILLYITIGGNPSFIFANDPRSAFLHHFLHANWFHLALNSYAVAVLYSRRFAIGEFAIAYCIASLSFFCADTPAIGFSNMLYATMGIRTPSLKSSWWRSPNTIVFLIITVAYLFLPQFSAITHIVSFAGGTAYSCLRRELTHNNSDYDKARGSRN